MTTQDQNKPGTFVQVTYTSVDGFLVSQNFNTVEEAQSFCWEWIGEAPTFGRGYAISEDGIGKIEARGCSLQELFPKGC
jgi:hypothetical protein